MTEKSKIIYESNEKLNDKKTETLPTEPPR